MSVFAHLVVAQLANVRWAWRWQLLGGLIAPLAFMFMLRRLDATLGPHILAGNLVLSTITGVLGSTTSRFVFLRESEGLDYYAVLPVGRAQLVVAIVLAFVALAAPGMIGTFLLGWLLFDLPLAPHPLAVLVLFLAALSMAGAGTALGILAPDRETSGALANLLLFVLLFLSPVLVPLERLPAAIQLTSRLLPTSYAVEAFELLLVGRVDAVVLLDTVALAAFSLAALYLATRRLDWRRR